MQKVLEGIKVLDMSVAAAGPSCSRMLVDFGAEDIMIEPLNGMSTRYTAPHSYHFKCGGKKSVPVDLKSAEGKELFLKLVKWADVFVSNYRTKALQKLGFSYEELSAVNPRLVYGTLTGFGDRGPQKDDPGFDATAWWAKSGMLVDAAQKGSIVQIPYATGDFSAGHSLALGICAALVNRERTGKGSKVSTSLMASGIFLNYDAIVESQYGLSLPTTRKQAIRATLNTYQCGDGEWVSINATHHWDVSWPCICNLIGRPELIGQYPSHDDTMREHSPAVIDILDEGFKKLTQEEVYQGLKACGTISVEKVQHSIDVTADPQALENGFVVEWTDPNGKKIMHPATPVRIGDEIPAEVFHGPKLGEHTVEVMKMLGYKDNVIQDYIDRNIVVSLNENADE
jgi:crotonobetainyl-CoA:carnitine CoA-transferase CaiB-like acyl-CoA transferase